MYLSIKIFGKQVQYGPYKDLSFTADGEIAAPGLVVKRHPVWGSWFLEDDRGTKLYFDPDSLQISNEPLVAEATSEVSNG